MVVLTRSHRGAPYDFLGPERMYEYYSNNFSGALSDVRMAHTRPKGFSFRVGAPWIGGTGCDAAGD